MENFHNRGSLYRTSKLSELFLDYGSLIKGRRGERETDHLYHPPPMEFGFAAKLYLRVVDPEENSCGKARWLENPGNKGVFSEGFNFWMMIPYEVWGNIISQTDIACRKLWCVQWYGSSFVWIFNTTFSLLIERIYGCLNWDQKWRGKKKWLVLLKSKRIGWFVSQIILVRKLF